MINTEFLNSLLQRVQAQSENIFESITCNNTMMSKANEESTVARVKPQTTIEHKKPTTKNPEHEAIMDVLREVQRERQAKFDNGEATFEEILAEDARDKSLDNDYENDYDKPVDEEEERLSTIRFWLDTSVGIEDENAIAMIEEQLGSPIDQQCLQDLMLNNGEIFTRMRDEDYELEVKISTLVNRLKQNLTVQSEND